MTLTFLDNVRKLPNFNNKLDKVNEAVIFVLKFLGSVIGSETASIKIIILCVLKHPHKRGWKWDRGTILPLLLSPSKEKYWYQCTS